ncbi:N-acetyltransferase family protein [Metabacillus sp. 84]|uniref:GNAT family N-acetyltransferase n=1 Tax=unclassified Metabacillus TaxID=2675274 RepID=UPI003CFB3D58
MKTYHVKGLTYIVRQATEKDAAEMSSLRLQIDGETENLDREPGEAFIDQNRFEQLINKDAVSPVNLFLVAEARGQIVGFSRCEGNTLKRFSHKAEFGIGILKEYWGFGIGRKLLSASIAWADAAGLKKMTLNVLETNQKAIRLYEKHGFKVEGVLECDKILSDGRCYSTIVMGRVNTPDA